MTTDQFAKLLYQRAAAVSKARYRLPETEENARKMLYMAYRSEMSKRGVDELPDQVSADRIGRVARWLVEGRKPGLLLYGKIGNGKTTMANAICETIGIIHNSPVSSQRKLVRRVTATQVNEAKASGNNPTDPYALLRDAPMLFIDDLGTEGVTIKSWGNEFTPMIDLLYHRYDNQLFTIITSNLDDARISDSYGSRVLDRFNEMFDKLDYQNESYRK